MRGRGRAWGRGARVWACGRLGAWMGVETGDDGARDHDG